MPDRTDLLKRHGWVALAVVFAGVAAFRLTQAADVAGDGFEGLASWIPDVTTFAQLGDAVLRGDLARAYADPFNQAGPLQIVGDAVLYRAAGVLPAALPVTALAFTVALVPLLVAGWLAQALIARMADVTSRWLWLGPWLSVLLVAVLGVDEENVVSGHWWQVPVLVLWVLAGRAVTGDRPLLAGVLVGVSAGLEPWGVFGVLVAVLAPGLRAAAHLAAASAVTTAALWLPFVATGSFRIGDYTWLVRSDSAWAVLVGPGSDFPWGLRILQAALVAGAATWMLIRLVRPLLPAGDRYLLTACVLTPVVIVLLRVCTDIWFGAYYLTSPSTLLVPAAVVWLLSRHRAGLWLAAAAWLAVVAATGLAPFLLTALALAALAVGLRVLAPRPALERV